MLDRLQTLRLFVQVARLGSFSQGARALRLSQPTASRLIATLEQELGAKLLLRSPRAVTLTDLGATYLERVEPLLRSFDEVDEEVRGGNDLGGTLRVGSSTVVASQTIVPILAGFTSRYPRLSIELIADDRRQDMLRDGIDVAIRFGTLLNTGTVARLIGRWPIVVAAAADYADRPGMPDHPEALREQTFLLAGPLAGRDLVFRRGEERVKISPRGRIAIDNAVVAVEATKAGLGLCVASLQTFQEHFRTRRLAHVLPEWSLGETMAHAVYPGGQGGKPAARAFVDHLVAAMKAPAQTIAEGPPDDASAAPPPVDAD